MAQYGNHGEKLLINSFVIFGRRKTGVQNANSVARIKVPSSGGRLPGGWHTCGKKHSIQSCKKTYFGEHWC